MEKDFHIELIKAINEPDQAKWDYLDNLRKETKLSKTGFIAKLKEANNNIFQAWKSLEMDKNLKLPGVENWSFPFNSFLYYPHLKDFSTQFQGQINEQHLKTLENFIKLYELRILQKDYLKKVKKGQINKGTEKKIDQKSKSLIINSEIRTKLFDGLKQYFEGKESELKNLLDSKKIPEKLVWPLNQNQLADLFLRLTYNGFIKNNKTQIKSWLAENFTLLSGQINESSVYDILKRKSEINKDKRILEDLAPFKPKSK